MDVRSVAIQIHAGQKYGEHPYIFHLDQVAELVTPFGLDYVQAAYLHDSLEDTTATAEGLLELGFPKRVVRAVEFVTDKPGRNRFEKKAKTYAFLKNLDVQEEAARIALTVKTADRLANVRMSSDNFTRRNQWQMYQTEHRIFKEAVQREGWLLEWWYELELILHPDNHPIIRR